MTADLWSSAASVRKCLVEKLSFVLLNQLDLALTLVAFYLGLSEINPLMAIVLKTAPLQLVLFKVAIPALIAWLCPGKLLIPGVAALLFVVGWDIKELFVFISLGSSAS